tara:strand:+ start:4761 stop:5141 length:381 start_codon:yes stop_codon:yes gene_type:complete
MFRLPNYYSKTFDGKFVNPTITPFIPHIKSYYEYIDVNQDKKLQKNVTMFFYREMIDNWIINDIQYKKFKNKKLLKKKDGLQLIYKILNKLVKKGETNWYDLRDPQYELTKDFIFYQLNKFFASLN